MKILSSGAVAVLIQATGVALAFLVQLTLARLLGAEQFGVFAFFFSLAIIFGTWSRLGSDMAVMRIGGEMMASNAHQLRHVVTHGIRVALIGGAGASLILIAGMLAIGTSKTHGTVLALAAVLVVLVGINGVGQAGLLTLGRTAVALVPEMLLRPVVALLLLILILLSGAAAHSGAVLGMTVMVAAAAASLFVIGYLLSRLVPASQLLPPDSNERARWTRLGIVLMAVNASYLLVYHSDTILLGLKLAPESIGPYQIAKQVSQLGLFAMIAVQLVFGPRMAGLVASQQWSELQHLFRAIVWLGAGFAAAMLVIFTTAGQWIIALFGPAYSAAYELGLVLLTSQLAIALVGPVGVLASMSGHQSLAAGSYLIGALLMLTIGPAIVDTWGFMGAAIAQGVIALLCAVAIGIGIARSIPIYRTVQAGQLE